MCYLLIYAYRPTDAILCTITASPCSWLNTIFFVHKVLCPIRFRYTPRSKRNIFETSITAKYVLNFVHVSAQITPHETLDKWFPGNRRPTAYFVRLFFCINLFSSYGCLYFPVKSVFSIMYLPNNYFYRTVVEYFQSQAAGKMAHKHTHAHHTYTHKRCL